jgi:hypothetical protein
MKSGPGPSMISVWRNSTTMTPPCPSETTVSEPVIGVLSPGGPRTTPGCQVLNAGGELTVPTIRDATRSGKQPRRCRHRSTTGRRPAGRPDGEQISTGRRNGGNGSGGNHGNLPRGNGPREKAPRTQKTPRTCSEGSIVGACTTLLSRGGSSRSAITGRSPGLRLSTRRPFPVAFRRPVGFPGFRYRSQLRGSGGLAPPSQVDRRDGSS